MIRSNPAHAVLLTILSLASFGCGDQATTESEPASPATSTAVAASTREPAQPAASAIEAAPTAELLETKYFSAGLPIGWEVLADDLERMGMMTLSEKGSGGAQGVYLKFEAGFSGDPMKPIEKFAEKYGGTPAERVSRNGVDWARTRYSYNGIDQSLNITAHGGRKVTFTVMGRDYDEDPGVKAIFDSLSLH